MPRRTGGIIFWFKFPVFVFKLCKKQKNRRTQKSAQFSRVQNQVTEVVWIPFKSFLIVWLLPTLWAYTPMVATNYAHQNKQKCFQTNGYFPRSFSFSFMFSLFFIFFYRSSQQQQYQMQTSTDQKHGVVQSLNKRSPPQIFFSWKTWNQRRHSGLLNWNKTSKYCTDNVFVYMYMYVVPCLKSIIPKFKKKKNFVGVNQKVGKTNIVFLGSESPLPAPPLNEKNIFCQKKQNNTLKKSCT